MNRLIKVVCSTVFVPNPSAFLTFLMNDLSLRGLFCHTFELLVSILWAWFGSLAWVHLFWAVDVLIYGCLDDLQKWVCLVFSSIKRKAESIIMMIRYGISIWSGILTVPSLSSWRELLWREKATTISRLGSIHMYSYPVAEGTGRLHLCLLDNNNNWGCAIIGSVQYCCFINGGMLWNGCVHSHLNMDKFIDSLIHWFVGLTYWLYFCIIRWNEPQFYWTLSPFSP